jgi:hypothetical protein
MNRVAFSILFTTFLFLIFAVLCLAPFNLSLVFLNFFLLLLNGLLIWMVVTVLKHGEPSKYTFDERFYEDMEK